MITYIAIDCPEHGSSCAAFTETTMTRDQAINFELEQIILPNHTECIPTIDVLDFETTDKMHTWERQRV